MSRNNDSNGREWKKTQSAITEGGSVISKYQNVVVGNRSLIYTIYYEICMWLSHIPGALGLALRKIFWPKLFSSCGKGVVFGEGIILRHPKKIKIGNRVVFSERCILDARTTGVNDVIYIGDDVIFSNDVTISCKESKINIGNRTAVSAYAMIHARINCPVDIGEDALIGPRCYITAGGSYNIDRLDIPISKQGKTLDDGILIENDVLLYANTIVLGGLTLGSGCVVGAGGIVTKSLPPRSICMGIPAKVMKMRDSLVTRSSVPVSKP